MGLADGIAWEKEFESGDTYFTIYDLNENIVFEEKDNDFINSKNVKPKPPLGVMPKNIYELKRVQDLCRALYEYSTYEEIDYELMIKWSDELNDRLYGLKGDKLNKEIENEDELWECL